MNLFLGTSQCVFDALKNLQIESLDTRESPSRKTELPHVKAMKTMQIHFFSIFDIFGCFLPRTVTRHDIKTSCKTWHVYVNLGRNTGQAAICFRAFELSHWRERTKCTSSQQCTKLWKPMKTLRVVSTQCSSKICGNWFKTRLKTYPPWN